MSDLKRKFFSGSNAEKRDEIHQAPHEIYCESQNVNDYVTSNEKEEQVKETEIRESKKKSFLATYNTFF